MIASCFALFGFAATIVINVSQGNSFTYMMWRALAALGVCWIIGRIVGGVMQKTVTLYIEQYKKDFPIDDEYAGSTDADETVSDEQAAAAQAPPGATPQPNA